MPDYPNYYAILCQNPANNPNITRIIKTSTLQRIFRECFAGFANTDDDSPHSRIAIICTRVEELSKGLYDCLCTAFASQNPDEPFKPGDVIRKSNLKAETKQELYRYQANNAYSLEQQSIRRNNKLCIGHFCAPVSPDNTIDNIIRFHVIVPSLCYLIPPANQEHSIIYIIQTILRAIKNQDDEALNEALGEYSSWCSTQNNQALQDYQTSTSDKNILAKRIAFYSNLPRYFRFILFVPFEEFDNMCNHASHYIDRVIRLEITDSLTYRFTNTIDNNTDNKFTFSDFEKKEYPDLEDLTLVKKDIQENQYPPTTNIPHK